MKIINTFGGIVKSIENKHSNARAFNYLDNGSWKSISTESFIFNLKRLTLGLISAGLKRGDCVGILADSSPFWILADFAVIIAGGISVPIFDRISDVNLIFEMAQTNIRFIFMEGERAWRLFDENRHLFEKVIALDRPRIKGRNVIRFYDMLKRGERYWQNRPDLFEQLINMQKPDDIVTIIYTSGVTGMPKGVELTHRNLTHLINYNVYGWRCGKDRYLGLLPLAHIFARQINLIMMAWGVPIYYLNDLSLLASVCRKIKPSLMIVVPRLLEKMYEDMEAAIDKRKESLLKKMLSRLFHLAGKAPGSFLERSLLFPLADLLLYRRIRKFFGGRWRVILSGGAALDEELYQFYLNIGFPVYEGWGLTEAGTVVVNQPGKIKVGTVGVPLPEIEIKLGENGEVLVAGPTVMKGYYRHPETTRKVIDDDGWLHTGDKGCIDEEGFLKLTGRIKEQFKLSSGEFVAPVKVEEALCRHPLISTAVVVGNKRKFVAALLFPDFAYLEKLKQRYGAEGLTDEAFLDSVEVAKEIDKHIEKIGKKLNPWERVGRYIFVARSLSVEAGDMTPTLELVRDAVLEKFKDKIEELYYDEEEED